MVTLIKKVKLFSNLKEMELLHNVDIPGSNVDEYVKNLDNMLNEKQELLISLKVKITNFRDHLKEEEVLSKKFYE
jgi:kinesin family protein 2/24